MSKLLIIGLDGATLDLIEPWAKAGNLPVLSKLMENGAYGRLQSVLPVLSSAAWSSFMTGMNPGKHGLYDFVKREHGSYRLRPVNHDQMRGKTLWKILSELGQKVIVMNVPMTYPPEPVNGILVSGLGTPDYKIFTYPPELSQELRKRDYPPFSKAAFHTGREQDYLQEVKGITDRITDTAVHFMKDQEWQFFMVVYREPDEMAHFFWHYMDPTHPQHPAGEETPFKDAIQNYYQRIDRAIGQLLETSGPDTNLIIMSDHGTGPLYKDVLLNEWLRQKGWLVTRGETKPGGFNRKVFASVGLTRSNVSAALRRLRLGRVERWLKDVLGDRIEILPISTQTEFPNAIDWQRTKAYSFGYHGQIYINLKGREPLGTVSPGEEYNQLCIEITNTLKTFVDPEDGRPIVDQVISRDQAFHGPAYAEAPDLIVIMRELSYITRSGYEFGKKSGEILASPRQFQSGSHRMEGVLLMAGPGVRQAGYKGNKAGLIDLAPTALHLLGFPVPNNMDGNVLQDWLSEQREVQTGQNDNDSLVLPPIEETLTPEQEQELVQRLKDLGYLE